MTGPSFEFYAIRYDINKKTCVMFNIFDNFHVYEESLKEVKKHLRDKKKYSYRAFCDEIRKIIMWQEWGRVEYECSIGEPFPDDLSSFKKVDCYWQTEPNIELIADMIIKRYKAWRKENETDMEINKYLLKKN